MVEYTCDVVRINDASETSSQVPLDCKRPRCRCKLDLLSFPDGPEQAKRDEVLANLDQETPCSGWKWADVEYQRDLLVHEAVDEALKAFVRLGIGRFSQNPFFSFQILKPCKMRAL